MSYLENSALRSKKTERMKIDMDKKTPATRIASSGVVFSNPRIIGSINDTESCCGKEAIRDRSENRR